MHPKKLGTGRTAGKPSDDSIIPAGTVIVQDGQSALLVVDGQHRVAAYRRLAQGYSDLADFLERGAVR